MPKIANEMSALEVGRLKEPGYHFVGAVTGLILQVTANGGRSWLLRAKVGVRRREIGLGSYPSLSLADARARARAIREKIFSGVDPVEERHAAQREALRKILHGESTAPGATHFFVFNSTMSQVLGPIYARFETLEIDVPARRARVVIPGYVDAVGEPIVDPHSKNEFRARIQLPSGFEYDVAEVGTGRTRTTAGIELTLSGTYGQFNLLHMNQDGVIH